MLNYQMVAVVSIALPQGVSSWLRHLGGVGLVLLGLVDNSVIPVPGSMDALTIVLSTNQKQWWPYYAFMATLGSAIGGYLTYQFARRGGKQAMRRRLSRSRAEKVEKRFARWGFAAITIPAILPPPVPMVPFLLAAGATQYPRARFLTALLIGRSIRYSLLALLGGFYGGEILRSFEPSRHPFVIGATATTIVVILLIVLLRRRKPAHGHV